MNNKIKNLSPWILPALILASVAMYLVPKVLLNKKTEHAPPSQLIAHINNTYGFSVTYPKTINVETTFQKYPSISDSWIAGATKESKGKALLCIPIFRATNDNSYPRNWNTEVRIGITTDPNDLQSFLSRSIYANTPPKQEIINGITFYVFPIQEAGMMKFLSGFSYRTIHNGIGYAIEQIKAGSIYRDTNSPKDVPDSVLDAYFSQTTAIVKSFQFID